MAHIFIPRCIQGTLFGVNTVTGQQLEHVFDFEAPGTVSAADCQAVCNLLLTWWQNNYRSHVGSHCSSVRAVAVGRDQFEGATYEIAGSTPGLITAGTVLPAEATCSIKLAGTNIGRSRRGRKYVWPQRTSQLDLANSDMWSQAAVDSWVLDFGNLLANAATAGYPVRIASNRRATLYPVSRVIAVDRIVDSQRRRTLGHGR